MCVCVWQGCCNIWSFNIDTVFTAVLASVELSCKRVEVTENELANTHIQMTALTDLPFAANHLTPCDTVLLQAAAFLCRCFFLLQDVGLTITHCAGFACTVV